MYLSGPLLVLLVGAAINALPQRNTPTLIVGGQDADISDIPYIVSLQYHGAHTCGGTIIARNLVVTAAHCVYGRTSSSPYTIRAGSSFTNQGGQVRQVAEVTYHEKFSMYNLDYDVALLKLEEPLILGEKVAVLELIAQYQDLLDGVPAKISGWGATKEGGGPPRVLQSVTVPIVDNKLCSMAYEKLGYSVTTRMICAGIATGGMDSCQGDSGGPMVIDGQLVGIVSWGIGCARPGYPGVYAKVAALREWLDYRISKMNEVEETSELMYERFGQLEHGDIDSGYLTPELLGSLSNSGRIVGGESAEIEDIPYIVSLQRGYWGHTCGGTIVDNDLIITAAHCVKGSDPSTLSIRAGSKVNSRDGQVKKVSSLIYHEQYSSSTLDYDLAILKLSEPLEYNEQVQPAKLPESTKNIPDGEIAVISGWGTLREGGSASRELQTVQVPIVSQNSCKEAYKRYYDITPRMICAGISEGGKDACQGDSGGPLVVDGYLIGAVSWGVGCARPNYPGVYTRVSELRTWVDLAILRLRQ